jgi:predicted permease
MSFNRMWRRYDRLSGPNVPSDIREELRFHIEAKVDDLVRQGWIESAARKEAERQFGSVSAMQREGERVGENIERRKLLGEYWSDVLQDLRYCFRKLVKSPGFSAVAILTLALGIGANIVVFGVLNAVILHPLNVGDPDNLYQIFHKEWMSGGPSYPAFEDYGRRNTTFSGMAAFYGLSSVGLRWHNAVRKVWGYDATGNYFDLLGVEPQIGRFFHASDEHGPNSAPYVVLSDQLWRSAFGADPGVIGATVELNRHPFTVIGVAPKSFQGTERFFWPDYWVPMVNEVQTEGWDFLTDRVVEPVNVIGRLKPGVTKAQATADLNRIAGELAKEYPATDKDQSARLTRPGLEGDTSDLIRKFLFGVMTLAFLVLLASCANLASLLAARAADRSRELAMRLALGSSRRRLLRQMLTESTLTALLGGALGMGGASLLLVLLSKWQPFGDGAKHLQVTLDWKVYAAALGLSVLSGLLFGMLPARQAWQSSPLRSIKNGPVETRHLRRFAVRDLLLGVQIAICTLLVTASLVAARSMQRMLHTPLGIEPQGVTLAEMDLGMVGIDGDEALAKQKQMIDAVMSIPGVMAAGTVNFAPLSGAGARGIPIYRPEMVDRSLSNQVLASRVYPVSPGYFAAAGTRLLTGRNLRWTDDNKRRPHAAIVNQTFARKMYGTAPAVGRQFVLWNDLYEVVGVAEDGKYGDLTESPESAVYASSAQYEQSNMLVVRSHLPENEIAAALQRTLEGIEPGLPIKIQSWPDALSNVLFPARTAAAALGVMGMLAAMLAVTGIFGMAAYSVSKRMKELGIRVALGARRVHLMQAAIGRPLVLLVTGSALGLVCGILTTRFLSRLVYDANPSDPLVLAGVVATMALLGVFATCVPARRALRVNPSELMREE